MGTKNLLSGICVASVAALSLVGCSDYDNGYTEKSIIYDKQFTDRFGQIDPNQDWNLVRQLAKASRVSEGSHGFTITVDDKPVSLTADNILEYKTTLPEGENNLGKVTEDFYFEDVNELILYPVFWYTSSVSEIGLYYYDDENGEPVNTVDNNTVNIVKIPICNSKPEELECLYINKVWGRLTEMSDDESLQAWELLTQEYSTKYIIASENKQLNDEWGNPFNCEAGDKLIYDSESERYVIYDITRLNNNTFGCWDDITTIAPDKYTSPTGKEMDANGDVMWGTNLYLVSESEDWETVVSALDKLPYIDLLEYKLRVDALIEQVEGSDEHVPRDPIKGFRTHGIRVTFPKTMNVGMYLDAGNHIKYSEEYLNLADNKCYAATFESSLGNQLLCFEDWEIGDYDLNDVVFRIQGVNSQIVDKEKPQEDTKKEEEVTTVISEGLLVCEDLGDYDFDFNDIVLKLQQKQTKKVTKINGVEQSSEILSNTLDVTAMAAGGTLTSYIYYKYNKDSEGEAISDDNEIHRLLGGSAPSIINAGPQFGREGKTITLEIGEGKDLEKWDDTTYSINNGGYVTQVFEHGLIYALVENQTPITNITSGTDYDKRNAPQMMLLPTDFLWPTEGTTISTVYEGFTNWVGNANVTNWYKNYNNINKVTQRSTGQ